MQDVLLVEETVQAGALLHPLRVGVLQQLAEPRSCPELAHALSQTTQKIYYHVKILEKSGLVVKVEERRVRGIMEGLYQARARAYWLSPRLVGRVGSARDQASLGFLLELAEEIQTDVARLAGETAEEEVPSLGLSAHIELRSAAERGAFRVEVQELFKGLAQKYGPAGDRDADTKTFQLSLVCYPR